MDGRPKRVGSDGIVQVPGLSFRPQPDITGDNWDFDRLRFDMNNSDDVETKIKSVDSLFASELAMTSG